VLSGSRNESCLVAHTVGYFGDSYFLLSLKCNESQNKKHQVAYTIVYNQGTPEEGIHTMKYPRGSDSDVLLAFEGIADCILFARAIKDDPALDQEPVPTPTSCAMIEQACEGMGIRMAFVPMENKTQW